MGAVQQRLAVQVTLLLVDTYRQHRVHARGANEVRKIGIWQVRRATKYRDLDRPRGTGLVMFLAGIFFQDGRRKLSTLRNIACNRRDVKTRPVDATDTPTSGVGRKIMAWSTSLGLGVSPHMYSLRRLRRHRASLAHNDNVATTFKTAFPALSTRMRLSSRFCWLAGTFWIFRFSRVQATICPVNTRNPQYPSN